MTWELTALKLGKRLTAAAVSRGKGRKGLISSEGCRGGAGGRTRAGRAGLWHVPPTERRAKGAISHIMHVKNKNKTGKKKKIKVSFEPKRPDLWVTGKNKTGSVAASARKWPMSGSAIRQRELVKLLLFPPQIKTVQLCK